MRTKIVRQICLLCTSSVILWGQAISTSQIKGTVQDASGSAVPGAEVKATQTGTGTSRTTTTASDGSYLLPELAVGPYQLEVTKQGFSKYVQKGITLQVNSNPTIDVSLKLGAVTEQVLVEASAAMVETENAGVGQVIDQQRVVDLPLNGRNVTDLLFLTGGTSEGRSFRSSYPTAASPSIAGGMTGSVSYWLDGGTNNDGLSNQNLPLPFPDALQEFKVETSSLPAQYGVHAAGAVNAITKSGGNEVHGDLFEFVRNYIFDARTTGYADATNPRDNLKRNQFGGTLGGPIKKDKLFFFFGYQATPERSSSPAQTQGLPTPNMLQGNFSGCGTLNPGIGQNDQVPLSMLSPIALKMAAILPTVSNASCGVYNYLSPTNYTENQGIAKIDYHQSARNTIFGRYFATHLEQQPGPTNQGYVLASVAGTSTMVQNLTLGDTFLVNPTTVNSFRATFNRSRCCGSFKVGHAGFNVLDLDRLSGVVENGFRGPNPSGRMGVLIKHDLQQGGGSCACALLKPSDGLAEGLSTSLAVRFLELPVFHPSQQGLGCNANRFGSLLDVALREQRRYGFFLLPPEFGPMAFHKANPVEGCPKLPSPPFRHVRLPA